MSKGGWDLSSHRSLASAAEWLRKGSGAVLVLVVRGQDGEREPDLVFAVDERVKGEDAAAMVEVVLPEMKAQVAEVRRLAAEKKLEKQARERAREHGAG